MGRLVRDPELRYTQDGTPVCAFTIAVDRRFNRDKTDFIKIIAWRNTAEFCAKHFQKGSKIALVGSIQTRTWEDDNGKKHGAVEVIAESVYFAESKRNDGQSGSPVEDAITSGGFIPVGDDEDLPF
ncbi:single-stranded DNA-binding protein [Gudongella oleilytica]|uniref:single-stranded DNA-binding protein n=1 Tax=Gudongella oleilytica TaxID=1582259 RepID=UPI002A35AF16|nr:single-stranded DNA-binding protein [Gudongella oleilytica]